MSTVPNSKGAPTAPWSPVVSVVVPTHLPDPPYLREALASVIAQDWANWEAIVVDDGSTATNETLEELVGADPRIRLLRGPRGGPARARNRGLRQARGELVAFLDSDDYWYPSHLASAVSTLAGNQEAVGTYTALALVLGTKREPFFVDRQWGPSNRHTALAGGNRPFTNSMVARRQAVEAVGGFDPRFGGAEDKDLVFKLLESGPCLYVDAVTVAYRLHGANRSAEVVRVSKAEAKVLAAHRERALAAGDTEAAAAIVTGRRRARRYNAGEAATKALRAGKSGDIKKMVVLAVWALRCSPPAAVGEASKRVWYKLLHVGPGVPRAGHGAGLDGEVPNDSR